MESQLAFGWNAVSAAIKRIRRPNLQPRELVAYTGKPPCQDGKQRHDQNDRHHVEHMRAGAALGPRMESHQVPITLAKQSLEQWNKANLHSKLHNQLQGFEELRPVRSWIDPGPIL